MVTEGICEGYGGVCVRVCVCVCVCVCVWYLFSFQRSHVFQEPKASSPWLRVRMCLEAWVTGKDKAQKRPGIFGHQDREGTAWLEWRGLQRSLLVTKGPSPVDPETLWEPKAVT